MTPAGGAVAALVGAAGLGAAAASTFFLGFVLWLLRRQYLYQLAVMVLLKRYDNEWRAGDWIAKKMKRLGYQSAWMMAAAVAWLSLRGWIEINAAHECRVKVVSV